MKIKGASLSNKVFIGGAVLVGISIFSLFAHESSLLGTMGKLFFDFLTMPIIAIGCLINLWETLKSFFERDYFTKDFNLVVFISYLLWFVFLSFMTGLACYTVINSYLKIFV